MKLRFNSFDVFVGVKELERYIGMRVNQIYDVDSKTYLLKLAKSGDEKVVILIESGARFHTTEYNWPKNVAPSGFSMKLRKHLKNKRLEKVNQLGIDRIVDFSFGSGEAEYHLILEMFDKGNVILADHNLAIVALLKPHVEGNKFKFKVGETYPLDRAKENQGPMSLEKLREILQDAKQGSNLKQVLLPNLEYGAALLEHSLMNKNIPKNYKIPREISEEDLNTIYEIILDVESSFLSLSEPPYKGFIIQKIEETHDGSKLTVNLEYHPCLFAQHQSLPNKEFDSFLSAVDEFFSSLEAQKTDLKTHHLEQEALKKVEKIRNNQMERVNDLIAKQEVDKKKADLIMYNKDIVETAILYIRTLIAYQSSWNEIQATVKSSQKEVPAFCIVKGLKLEINHITVGLSDPYAEDEGDPEVILVDINLDLSAAANAEQYYGDKKSAALKQCKTIASQNKALKSAEMRAKEVLKELKTMNAISKARKTFWFEKFYWFISSENYLIIGGRDSQQNELIVKRHLGSGDIYVHADVPGASSIIIKNPSGATVPPKTLEEAGMMAVCYSVAWEAKVICGAWWVYSNQVSKTAPAGEYLTTGSFMIHGKKNYLLPSQLSLGYTFLFKIDESCEERHRNERRIKLTDDEHILMDKAKDESKQDEEESFYDIDVSIPTQSEDSVLSSCADSSLSSSSQEINGKRSFPDTVVLPVLGRLSLSEEPSEESFIDGLQNLELSSCSATGECNHTSNQQKRNSTDLSKMPDGGGNEMPRKMRNGSEPALRVSLSEADESFNECDAHVDESNGLEEVNAILDSTEPTKGVFNEVNDAGQSTTSARIKEIYGKDSSQYKRGQKSKLKKIKNKYKDQDEEEKRIRMSILQSAGPKKESKKDKKKTPPTPPKGPKLNSPMIKNEEKATVENLDEDIDPADLVVPSELDMLDLLTGQPHIEDELLFALPMIAPYSSILNYKFKVKLTPGTTKRGKAVHTIVQQFTKLKDCTPREKDLLNAVDDPLLVRNMPGKVKISAPNLLKKK